MSTLIDIPRTACFKDGEIVIVMESGAELRFPVSESPRLAKGNSKQLNHIELSPFGIHWPDLDEDLSFRGIAEGDYGQSRTKH
ncbi:MAG: hypothetical protein NPIRA02_17590 [Nitrospirales bacterium]|nr:MAG: hypothetical protein NPIRA02_17590 [Nitrospirales bacterium]